MFLIILITYQSTVAIKNMAISSPSTINCGYVNWKKVIDSKLEEK